MLAGIYYGAQYGGSTTAILLNLPGESSAVVTALDGHQMAKQGRAGPALATAALGSFFAGTVATVLVALFAPPLAAVALEFGPADYFAIVVLGLLASIALASGSAIKALAMIVLGLLLGTIGQDQFTGVPRFTFGVRELYGGLDFVSLAVGLFGVAEIIRNLEHRINPSIVTKKVEGLWLTKEDFRRIRMPVLRGTTHGLPARRAARRRPRPGQLHVVLGGEADLQEPAGVRQGRHRGGGGAGVGQQRGRADVVHPAAHPGPAGPPGDGAARRRLHHPGHHPRSQRHQRRAGALLGADRVVLGRQPAADHAQPAADRALGADAERALQRALPGDHRLRVDRLLLPGPQLLGRVRRRGGRRARLLPHPLGLRGGAAAARASCSDRSWRRTCAGR